MAANIRRITSRGAICLATVLAGLASLSCGGPPVGDEEFTLIADSLGDVPMHPDALKVDNLENAHDGSMATRWTSVANMEPGFFVELKFVRPRKVAGLVLNTKPSPRDFPRKFVVEVSRDGNDWEEAAAGGTGATKKGITTINFDRPREVQYVLITVSEAAPYWWSIYELEVKYAE
ncbi:MAG: hypothetical protein GTN49_11625 [candidate division Zixibacteria bacterium]|nr:hypothetical protein [candidate division Zixibacteria bacterium]